MDTRVYCAVGGNTHADMTTGEARALVGQYGEIHANGDNYPKWLHGKITDVDRTMIEFTDNHGNIHLFKTVKVVSFDTKEFKPITE